MIGWRWALMNEVAEMTGKGSSLLYVDSVTIF